MEYDGNPEFNATTASTVHDNFDFLKLQILYKIKVDSSRAWLLQILQYKSETVISLNIHSILAALNFINFNLEYLWFLHLGAKRNSPQKL